MVWGSRCDDHRIVIVINARIVAVVLNSLMHVLGRSRRPVGESGQQEDSHPVARHETRSNQMQTGGTLILYRANSKNFNQSLQKIYSKLKAIEYTPLADAKLFRLP